MSPVFFHAAVMAQQIIVDQVLAVGKSEEAGRVEIDALHADIDTPVRNAVTGL